MKIRVVKDIDPKWDKYDKKIAELQLAFYGKIYLDPYGVPIDDVKFLEMINEKGGKK